MAYNVQLSPHAVRQYKKLDPAIQARLRAAIDALQASPLSGPKVKRLKGRLHAYYRYREGEYRVVYAVDRHLRMIYIDYLTHRKDVYRDIE